MDPRRVAAIVLAAGAGTRFRAGAPDAGPKLLADLGGRRVLQHVLDVVADIGPAATVVVLGHDAPAIEGAIAWRGEHRAVNPHPDRGLSSSVRVGLAALEPMEPGGRQEDPSIQAALIFLGDQPDVSVEVTRELIATATESGPPLLVPSYPSGAAPNPVLVRRAGWPLASGLRGDRGFGPLIASRPELVERVAVTGAIHDIDTPADLLTASRALAGPRGSRRQPPRAG